MQEMQKHSQRLTLVEARRMTGRMGFAGQTTIRVLPPGMVAGILAISCWSVCAFIMPALEEAEFLSANQEWRVQVKPGMQPGYPESVAARRRHGEDTGPEGPLFFIYAEATLSHRKSLDIWEQVWSRRLYNQYAPMRVLIADDGSYVVTLGDVRDMLRPFSENDVVVYGAHGGLLDRMEIRSLLSEELRMELGAPNWPGQSDSRRNHSPYPAVAWTSRVELNESKRELLFRNPSSPNRYYLRLTVKSENGRTFNSPDHSKLSQAERLYLELRNSLNLRTNKAEILRLMQSSRFGLEA